MTFPKGHLRRSWVSSASSWVSCSFAMVEMISIRKEDVPLYLQNGQLFESLDSDDAEQFTVPADAFKASPTFETACELSHLLESLRYWAVACDAYESQVIQYLVDNDISSEIRILLADYREAFPLVHSLDTVFAMNDDKKLSILDRAATSGPLYLVQALVRKDHKLTPSTLVSAIAGCHLDIVEFLVDHCNAKGFFSDVFPRCEQAMPCLEFLKKRGMWHGKQAIEKAASDGAIDGIKILLRHQYTSRSACYYAAKHGHLECLEYLYSQKSYLFEKTSLVASTNGHLNILQFLHEKACRFDLYCCREAAHNGHLDCLRFLHDIGRPWGVYVCSHAAKAGHLACLQYAHENGCGWNEITCCDAAEKGQLLCLQYAHEKGCPWDHRTTTNAVKHLPCLVFALENDCPYLPELAEIAFRSGADSSGFYVLQHCIGLPATVYAYAAQFGRLDIMQAAYEAGISWHVDTCATAAQNGHQECLRFAISHGAAYDEVDIQVKVEPTLNQLHKLLLEKDSFFH